MIQMMSHLVAACFRFNEEQHVGGELEDFVRPKDHLVQFYVRKMVLKQKKHKIWPPFWKNKSPLRDPTTNHHPERILVEEIGSADFLAQEYSAPNVLSDRPGFPRFCLAVFRSGHFGGFPKLKWSQNSLKPDHFKRKFIVIHGKNETCGNWSSFFPTKQPVEWWVTKNSHTDTGGGDWLITGRFSWVQTLMQVHI